MNAIDVVEVGLHWAESDTVPPSPHLLRGALADRFRHDALFHQHGAEGPIYRYPKIHYRWSREGASVVGFGSAVRPLMEIPWSGLSLRIGPRVVTVADARCFLRRHTVKQEDRLVRYRFGAPWIPFNQDNYRRYRAMDPDQRAGERDRMAIAGLLVALRGLEVHVNFRIYAAFEMGGNRPCTYKGLTFAGFRGALVANVDLPEGLAIGRAVSHGYGWLTRAEAPAPHRSSSNK